MTKLQIANEKNVWDEYILSNGGHPFQLWGWGAVKESHGWHAERLFVADKRDKWLYAVQVLVKPMPWPFHAFAYIPRHKMGERTGEADYLKTVGQYIRKKFKAVVLSIEPHETESLGLKGWNRSSQMIFPDETLMLNLTMSESELLSDMSKSTRQSINKGKRRVDRVGVIQDQAELEKALEIYHETAKHAGFALHSDDYYQKVKQELGEASLIYGAYINDTLVAFLWVARSNSVAFQMYSGVSQEGKSARAAYALRWRSITDAKRFGIRDYDFNGLITGGVSEFKRGWSSSETKLVGTYDLPLSKLYLVWTQLFPVVKNTTQLLKKIKRNLGKG